VNPNVPVAFFLNLYVGCYSTVPNATERLAGRIRAVDEWNNFERDLVMKLSDLFFRLYERLFFECGSVLRPIGRIVM
jgi:hypothetical protein